MKRVAYHNLGCKVNYCELMAVIELFRDAGYDVVSFDDEADVYIINTCSVTNIADHKSRQMIKRARRLSGHAIVVAMGCFAQSISDKEAVEVGADIIIGNNRKHNIISDISEFYKTHRQIIDIEDIDDKSICYEELGLARLGDRTRAFIKIQDGCNEFCSYCIIPYRRGRVRSRSIDSIIEEITGLALDGCKEFVLTGINISSYSYKRSERETTLIDLIEAVNDIDCVDRIRLGSIEPRLVTDEFVRRLSACGKVCAHFHLSLQSGSDSVLMRMNRKYTTKDYYESVLLFRRYYKRPAITCDVIVGFPGETQEEFGESLAFTNKVHFYDMHVFKYSRRQGTKADRMDGHIDESIKKSRSNQLISKAKKMSEEYISDFLGKAVEVLIEEEVLIDGVRYYRGYTREYINAIIISDNNLIGQLIRCVGCEVMGLMLVVKMCD